MTAYHNILLVTARPSQLKEFSEVFGEGQNMAVVQIGNIKEAIKAVKEMKPILAVVDDQVRGAVGLDIIRRLIQENAFIQTAAISDLNDDEFHVRSEGLGVLSKLPLVPTAADARKLIELLEQVSPSIA